MECAFMEPEINYKFTALLIVAICILALFGGPTR
jgi:hypothetical protein